MEIDGKTETQLILRLTLTYFAHVLSNALLTDKCTEVEETRRNSTEVDATEHAKALEIHAITRGSMGCPKMLFANPGLSEVLFLTNYLIIRQ